MIEGQNVLGVVKTFQAAIVGLIGFAGVIITLVANARIARQQVREAQDHETEPSRVPCSRNSRLTGGPSRGTSRQ